MTNSPVRIATISTIAIFTTVGQRQTREQFIRVRVRRTKKKLNTEVRTCYRFSFTSNFIQFRYRKLKKNKSESAKLEALSYIYHIFEWLNLSKWDRLKYMYRVVFDKSSIEASIEETTSNVLLVECHTHISINLSNHFTTSLIW